MPPDSSQEILDVVDANDNVIGTNTRGEIHRLGLMHRAVHVLVFNREGELFLQKRSMRKDNNPGLWDTSAAGHVDSGEDYENCAIREIGEELGVALDKQPSYLFRLPPTESNGMEHCKVYKCLHDGPFTLDVYEIDEGKWFTQTELEDICTENDTQYTSVLKDIWQRYSSCS
ncbi:MAG: NUDIX domain-containing protein [Pseudomonadota bacterium]